MHSVDPSLARSYLEWQCPLRHVHLANEYFFDEELAVSRQASMVLSTMYL